MSWGDARLLDMQCTEIVDEIMANATSLNDEANALAKLFSETKFLGDNRNFPHAHYGYLIACMGQIDLMSKCEFGEGEPTGGQSERMRDFIERYLGAQKVEEHRVAIQLMRHTLMHTGALRYLYEEKTETAYTWRIHFGDTFPADTFGHYTLNVEDLTYQDHMLAAVAGNVATAKAFNLQVTKFTADILRVAHAYTTAMSNDLGLQTRCQDVYPRLRVQPLKSPKH